MNSYIPDNQDARRHASIPEIRIGRLPGHVAPQDVMKRIGAWADARPLQSRNGGGLPPTLSAAYPGSGVVTYINSELAPMIGCLPRQERAAARVNLPGVLSLRLRNGQELLRSIFSGDQISPPEPRELSDIMLFLDARSRMAGDCFTEGSFSLEDRNGYLLRCLDSCGGAFTCAPPYMRTPADGRPDVYRAVRFAPADLPGRNTTLVFSRQQSGNFSGQRIFLKMLPFISPLVQTDGETPAEETGTLLPGGLVADPGIFFRNRNIFSQIPPDPNPGIREARIPAAAAGAYNRLLAAAAEYLPEAVLRHLKNNSPLDASQGLKTMLANLRETLTAIPREVHTRVNFVRDCRKFADTTAGGLVRADHLSSRIGNEVLIDEQELWMDAPDTEPPLPSHEQKIILLIQEYFIS